MPAYYHPVIWRFDVAKLVVSKVALAKARMKLKLGAFIELNRHLVNHFETYLDPRTWFSIVGH